LILRFLDVNIGQYNCLQLNYITLQSFFVMQSITSNIIKSKIFKQY